MIVYRDEERRGANGELRRSECSELEQCMVLSEESCTQRSESDSSSPTAHRELIEHTGNEKCITLFHNEHQSTAVVFLQNSAKVTINRSDFVRVSRYFQAAFCGHFLEANTETIFLEHIEMKTFLQCCAIVRDLLRGSSDLSWMNLKTAFKILDVASYLVIDVLLDAIAATIPSLVAADSLIHAFHYTQYRHVSLSRVLWKMITEEFDKILLNNSFHFLREEEIASLLREQRLNIVPSEETLMIEQWISHNEGVHGLGLCEEGGNERLLSRVPHSILLATGGWVRNGPTELVETLNMRSNSWATSRVQVIGEPRAYHAVVNTGRDLFTLGGYNGVEYFRAARRFRFDTLEWKEIAPSHEKRCYVSAGALSSDRIIVVGGHNELDRLRSTELFHIPSNQWTTVANMNVTRSDAHCATANGVVYVVGGFDGFSCHSSLEYYDPTLDRWIMSRGLMNDRRSGVGAIGIAGGIFVGGGFDGTHRLSSCELIDPREGVWHQLRPMLHQRSNFGIESLNSMVAVVGGYGGNVGTIADAEAFELRANAWMPLPHMRTRRSALFLTLIQDFDLIESLLDYRPSSTSFHFPPP